MKNYAVLLIFIFFIFIFFTSLPVSLWFLSFFGLMIFIGYIDEKLEKKNLEHYKSSMLEGIIFGFFDTTRSITIGIGLVWIAQLFLNIYGKISIETVKDIEYHLMKFKEYYEQKISFDFYILLFILLFLMLLTILLRKLKPIQKFVLIKKFASRLLIILATIVSFSFFSFEAVTVYEPEWIAKRRSDLYQSIKSINEAEQELVAISMIKNNFSTINNQSKDNLRDFFNENINDKNYQENIDLYVKVITQNTTQIKETDIDKKRLNKFKSLHQPQNESIEKIKQWLNETEHSKSIKISTIDLDVCKEKTNAMNETLAESKVALIEIVKNILGATLPESADPVIKYFAKSLVDSLIKGSLAKVFPKNVKDIATASLWLELVTYSPKQKMNKGWRAEMPSFGQVRKINELLHKSSSIENEIYSDKRILNGLGILSKSNNKPKSDIFLNRIIEKPSSIYHPPPARSPRRFFRR